VNAVWQQEAYVKASNTGAGDSFGTSMSLSAEGATLAVGAWPRIPRLRVSTVTRAATQPPAVVRRTSSCGWMARGSRRCTSRPPTRAAGTTSAHPSPYPVTVRRLRSARCRRPRPPRESTVTRPATRSVQWRGVHLWAGGRRHVAAGRVPQGLPTPKAGTTSAHPSPYPPMGATLAVGAYTEDSAATGIDGDQTNNLAEDGGAVYTFRRTDSVWQQEAYLKASNAQGWDYFGSSLFLSADGATLAVVRTVRTRQLPESTATRPTISRRKVVQCTSMAWRAACGSRMPT